MIAARKKKPSGTLIAIEGPENIGCSTQTTLLIESFQRSGNPTLRGGLGYSEFIGTDLEAIITVHPIRPHTMSLFHATEIFDQLEKKIIPALQAGFIVVLDRWIFSVIAQSMVRGVELKWLNKLFAHPLSAAKTFVLKAEPEKLIQRSFTQQGTLGFWDSGQDCVVRDGLYEGFIEYQKRQKKILKDLTKKFDLIPISADGTIEDTHQLILKQLS
jgi:dTMP kinase